MALISTALLTTVAYSQSPNTGNLERLSSFKTTTTNLTIPEVPQTGRRADQIKKNLERVKLPAGFKIDLYAVVPDARHMAVGPQTGIVFVGTRKTKVYTVIDQDKDRVADVVKEFAPTIDFKVPNGVCMSRDNFLFVAEHNRVLVFPAAEFFQEGPDTAAFVVVKQGELIPPEEESFNHGARVCRVGPDNKLYLSLGQPFNVYAKEKHELYQKVGIGGIVRMDRDGKN
ncbi:MAG: PQQ-dependent sugar dehydrogenase, partial [Bosea sp. (in: a-proteobacteria)]